MSRFVNTIEARNCYCLDKIAAREKETCYPLSAVRKGGAAAEQTARYLSHIFPPPGTECFREMPKNVSHRETHFT